MINLVYNPNVPKTGNGTALICLIEKGKQLPEVLNSREKEYCKSKFKNGATSVVVDRLGELVVVCERKSKMSHAEVERLRIEGQQTVRTLNENLINHAIISGGNEDTPAFVEGLMLGSYQFLKYFSDRLKRQNKLTKITVTGDKKLKTTISELGNLTKAVFAARDLVNEPVSYLTAIELGKQIKALAKAGGFKAEVFGKTKIESLKMGGLLAVNQGSVDDPTFSVLEWKPDKAINKKPVVLVGKGVVYDTGGLSLKPTPNSMDFMKADMGGAASVIGAIYAASLNKLPVHIIGLVPATDNRPGGNAFAPGDVVTVYDGSTVEIMNTDAEGRMILADALAYAKQYDPEIVIDLATLTGAAARAIGKFGIVGMSQKSVSEMRKLQEAGEITCERVVEFPLWDEYFDELKSGIADIKNLGSGEGGAITAGKFLAFFTDYPYIHLDIAGPAFLTSELNYRGKGGTGIGVRLVYEYLKRKTKTK